MLLASTFRGKKEGISLNRRYCKDHCAPKGMRGDLDDQVSFPEIQKPPKSTGHQSSQDEYEIPRKDMNSSINGSRDEIPGEGSPSFHEAILQKTAPEDFLSRAGDEEEK
jgi:hypothetical protein